MPSAAIQQASSVCSVLARSAPLVIESRKHLFAVTADPSVRASIGELICEQSSTAQLLSITVVRILLITAIRVLPIIVIRAVDDQQNRDPALDNNGAAKGVLAEPVKARMVPLAIYSLCSGN